mgnify:CR=1 FL=1
MNKLIFIVLFLPLFFVACGGGDSDNDNGGETPDGSGLKFSVDRNSIYKSGYDLATFTVKYDGIDVTEKSRIYERVTGAFLKGNTFKTTQAGTYVFTAEYKGEVSEEIEVTTMNEEYFQANLFMMHFTSTDCPNCPRMVTWINAAKELVPDRIVKISVHGPLNEPDPMQIDAYWRPLVEQYKVPGYPIVMLNCKRSWNTAEGTNDLEEFLPEKTNTGIAIDTKIEGDKAIINLKVKTMLGFEKPSRISIVIVEDNLIYDQKNGNSTDRNTVHDDVVRRYLTDVLGDKEPDLAAGKEFTKEYTYDISPLLIRDNLKIVVYVMNGDSGYLLNCREVKLGKSVDYQTIE